MLFDPTLEIPRYSWKLQRAYMWELALPDIGGISGLFVSTYCQDAKFGDYGMEEVASLRYGAFRAKYAGILDIPDLTLTFLRPVPDQVTAFFYAWRQLIITGEGFYNPKGNYARSIYFYLYDTTGAITNKIQLVGCFPKDLPGWDFSYNSEDVSKLTITISVDRMAFGEFVSPVFQQDTVQPFTRVDIEDTSSRLGPAQRTTIAPPQRFQVSTGNVPSSNFATERSFDLGAVISGVTSLATSLIGSITAPVRQSIAPAFNPPSVAKTGVTTPLIVPQDIALSLGSSISTFNDGAVRAATKATPIVLEYNGQLERLRAGTSSLQVKTNFTPGNQATMEDSIRNGLNLYGGGNPQPGFNTIPL